jgi:hypothetical protein
MKRLLERSFVVEAAAERVWAELVEAERWPRWARHLRSVQVTPPGPIGAASSATLRLTNHTTATVSVTEFQDGRRFRWEGSFLWLGLGYDHLVTTDETGRVSVTVQRHRSRRQHDRGPLCQHLRPQPGPRDPPTAGPPAIT